MLGYLWDPRDPVRLYGLLVTWHYFLWPLTYSWKDFLSHNVQTIHMPHQYLSTWINAQEKTWINFFGRLKIKETITYRTITYYWKLIMTEEVFAHPNDINCVFLRPLLFSIWLSNNDESSFLPINCSRNLSFLIFLIGFLVGIKMAEENFSYVSFIISTCS